MRKLFLIFLISSFVSCEFGKTKVVTGPDLIEQSIRFHDPNDAWRNFSGTFSIIDSLPAGKDSRAYELSFQNQLNKMHYRKDDLEFIVWEDSVYVFKGEIDQDRALMLRNYYGYLWGLPMKLKDPGITVDAQIFEEELNGKSFQVVRVPYQKDTWYFYFDPQTAQLEAYKFYPNDAEKKGEIIFLEGILESEGLKIPKNRSWFLLENNEFLGTDRLKSISQQNVD